MHARLNGPAGDLSLPSGASILGRGHDCALRVNDPRLSRHHARFHFDGQNLAVEDAGSTNGVLVNGDRISARTGLVHGDVVVCGPCVFTVGMDETRRTSVSELLPQPESKPASHSTEAMEPIVVTSADLSASKARRLDPKIAAALKPGHEIGSDTLLNPHEESGTGTSALTAPRRTKPTPAPRPGASVTAATASAAAAAAAAEAAAKTPQPTAAPPGMTAEPKRKERTTGLVPDDYKQVEKAALQADFGEDDPRSQPARWRRAVAGALDPLQAALIVAALAAPTLAGGYAGALARAGAILDNGLPRLAPHPVHAASVVELAASLFRAGGPGRAWELVQQLYQRDDQSAFLIVFASATVAVLMAVLVTLLGLVAATVLHGAPLWHRLLGLEIVEQRTGYYLTWLRALSRWALLALLLPLAPFGLALRRGPHDLACRCEVRVKRG